MLEWIHHSMPTWYVVSVDVNPLHLELKQCCWTYTATEAVTLRETGRVLECCGAPFGSVYLPAERPLGACSLWRTFGVQADPPNWALASLQKTLMCGKGECSFAV